MQSNRSRYIIARHGETYSNLDHRWQGMGNSPLTEKGKKQAEFLAGNLKEYHISRIITSNLPRAVETGRIISGIIGVRGVVSSEQLNERNLGVLEGLTSEEIKEKFGVDFRIITSTDIDSLERVEPWKSFVKRVFSYLDIIKKENNPGTTLLVTHGGTLRAIYNTLTNTNDQKVLFFNCSYMVIHPENGNCTIDSINTASLP